MYTMSSPLRSAALCAGAFAIAGCASGASFSPTPSSPAEAGAVSASAFGLGGLGGDLRGPVLIAFSGDTHTLQYWPINPKGGSNPKALSGPSGVGQPGGLAANGQRIAITNGNEVVVYDLRSKMQTAMSDPNGYPVDIAIGKSGALYVANILGTTSNVTVFNPGSPPQELSCKLLNGPAGIAVDNENDIFVNQNGTPSGVVEIPNGPRGPDPQHCKVLNLKAETGYAAGVAVDPKTDDLIVLDDPDLCAGGVEGRMTIYPRPYRKLTGRSHVVGQNCSGGIRLDATSTIVFVGDQSVSGGYGFILQHTYPGGRPLGTYSGGSPGGFTTVPNTLPN
jgi:hypothetical protein